jgi:uncharacterized protein YkwD
VDSGILTLSLACATATPPPSGQPTKPRLLSLSVKSPDVARVHYIQAGRLQSCISIVTGFDWTPSDEWRAAVSADRLLEALALVVLDEINALRAEHALPPAAAGALLAAIRDKLAKL